MALKNSSFYGLNNPCTDGKATYELPAFTEPSAAEVIATIEANLLALGAAGQVDSIVQGTNITVDNTDPVNPIVSALPTGIQSLVQGTNVTIDITDPVNPTINALSTGIQSLVQGTNISIDVTDPVNPTINADATGIQTLVQGTNVTVDATDPANPTISAIVPAAVASVVQGTDITVDATDPLNPIVNFSGTIPAAGIQSVVQGTNITVDATDPLNPIVSASGGGAGAIQDQQGVGLKEIVREGSLTFISHIEEGTQNFVIRDTTPWQQNDQIIFDKLKTNGNWFIQSALDFLDPDDVAAGSFSYTMSGVGRSVAIFDGITWNYAQISGGTLTSSTQSSTLGQLTKVGDYGLGVPITPLNASLNAPEFTSCGVIYTDVVTNVTDRPTIDTTNTIGARTAHYISEYHGDSFNGFQRLTNTASGDTFIRANNDNVLGTWRKYETNLRNNVIVKGVEAIIATGYALSATSMIFFMPIRLNDTPISLNVSSVGTDNSGILSARVARIDNTTVITGGITNHLSGLILLDTGESSSSIAVFKRTQSGLTMTAGEPLFVKTITDLVTTFSFRVTTVY